MFIVEFTVSHHAIVSLKVSYHVFQYWRFMEDLEFFLFSKKNNIVTFEYLSKQHLSLRLFWVVITSQSPWYSIFYKLRKISFISSLFIIQLYYYVTITSWSRISDFIPLTPLDYYVIVSMYLSVVTRDI